MSKLSCAQIRNRTLEIVLSHPNGIRRGDIEHQIITESPETPKGTISTQVNAATTTYAHLIERDKGCYRPKSSSGDLRHDPSPLRSSTTFDLASLGFVPAGHFDDDGPHVRRNLVQHADRCPALYAFVIEGSVMYIGKTIKPLSGRMDQYAKPGISQSTNLRNHASIKESLDAGKRVEIWVLVDWDPMEHRGVPINVAAGIEDALIERMSPPWNPRRGTS